MCEECCADASESLKCTHGVCTESAEWKKHYCADGEHCVESSADPEYSDSEHWIPCGDGCDTRLSVEPHSFGKGKIVKEATKKAEGILSLSCTECGYTKEESIPKLKGGHTHNYTDTVTPATCVTGGYTVHTCECGHSWVDNEIAASDHLWEYKSDENEHWQECTVCHNTTDKVSHKLGEWKTVKKPGYTFAGEKQRVCRGCQYTLSEELPMLTVPENKIVITIPNYVEPVKTPSSEVGGNQKNPEAPDTEKPVTDKPEADKTETELPVVSVPFTKELLTKGKDQAVPALPTLPDKDEGNVFDGWVNKATGETVKKGDKITESIELEPVWKDCGAENHTDENEDGSCDGCGYIIKTEEPGEIAEPEEPSVTDTENNGVENENQAKGKGMPLWLIILLILLICVVGACAVVIVASKKKKK